MCELNLWGIETCFLLPLFQWLNSCELNLWGIETATILSMKAVSCWCELNLWGIETLSVPLLQFFSLPCELNLWGIETFDTRYKVVDIISVNWTCEGLKPIPPTTSSHSRFWCELNLWGIETTTPLYNLCITLNVWIEPVRDWNIYLQTLELLNQNRVNWTCEGLKHNSCSTNWKRVPCELNLWGIETMITGRKFYQPQGVNWTCEGLKHNFFTLADLQKN